MSLIREKELDRMDRSLLLFENSIGTKSTLKQYTLNLKLFFDFVGYQNRYDEFLKLSANEIQMHLEDFVMYKKKTGVRSSSIQGYLNPVILFLDANKVLFHRKSLRMLIPKDKKKIGNEKPYLTEDIQKMLSSTIKLRNKAIIHFFSSTGARPAVVTDPILRFVNVHTMPFGCKAVLLYSESNEEYWAFLTPEASIVLDDYRDERIREGEIITPNSPVFIVQECSRYDKENYLSLPALNQIFDNLKKHDNIERIKIGNRYDKGQFLGFRKRFNTILKLEETFNANIAEKLMAHKRGLDGRYLKPTREECFKEFVKAIPSLTVSESERLKIKIENLETDKDQKITKLEAEMKAIYRLLERVNPNTSMIS